MPAPMSGLSLGRVLLLAYHSLTFRSMDVYDWRNMGNVGPLAKHARRCGRFSNYYPWGTIYLSLRQHRRSQWTFFVFYSALLLNGRDGFNCQHHESRARSASEAAGFAVCNARGGSLSIPPARLAFVHLSGMGVKDFGMPELTYLGLYWQIIDFGDCILTQGVDVTCFQSPNVAIFTLACPTEDTSLSKILYKTASAWFLAFSARLTPTSISQQAELIHRAPRQLLYRTTTPDARILNSQMDASSDGEK